MAELVSSLKVPLKVFTSAEQLRPILRISLFAEVGEQMAYGNGKNTQLLAKCVHLAMCANVISNLEFPINT